MIQDLWKKVKRICGHASKRKLLSSSICAIITFVVLRQLSKLKYCELIFEILNFLWTFVLADDEKLKPLIIQLRG